MSIAYRAIDPATGDVVAEYDTATDAEVEAALAGADTAASTWGALGIEERAAVATEIARLFAERKDELATLAQREMGKPHSEGVEEAEFCEAIFRYFATEGPGLAADQPIPTGDAGGKAVVQRRPLGALLGIMPWNFPYYQVARFVAPNLVLGNTMVVKHAESVPGCALAIQQLLADAGVPEGVYTNLFADHDQIETIIADPRIQGVSLTGSERAGAAVAALAGKNLKKCVLELGGSDPMIILDTDDVDAVVTAAWDFRTYNTGQACNANKRIIVVGDLFDDVVAGLTAKAQAVTNPSPLSSRKAAETLHEQVQDAVANGATLHAGGELGPDPTALYTPAVLSGITPAARAFSEELFGPVAAVYRVESAEEALELANSSAYGLGGSVFSKDVDRARALAERLECGMANVNSTAGEGAELPFGGVKRSGFGRELGPLGMEEFVNKRLMYIAD